MSNRIKQNLSNDGIDRRGFLRCMAWAGTGTIWTLSGGVPSSRGFAQAGHQQSEVGGDFSFVQISDSHIGFSHDPNKDVTATLQQAIGRIDALQPSPDFLIHTGDLTHLSKAAEFDTLAQVLQSCKVKEAFFVPGEHDVVADNGKQFLERYGKGTQGAGWYSFDHKGVHFVGLVNVVDLRAGGLGALGKEQLDWLKRDLSARTGSTPIVVFAHIPLWTVYPEWGWGTDDGAQALSYLRRFGSATVLNGHIHQVMQKVEGNIAFHTAMSTAFPQPSPGSAPSPGPMKVAADRLRRVLGITQVNYVQGTHMLAVVDSTLAAASETAVNIDNFSFSPKSLTVSTGTIVTWTNRDDIPHNVVSTRNTFTSPVLDTGEQFSFRFDAPGSYSYFCKIHPKMTGHVAVVKNSA